VLSYKQSYKKVAVKLMSTKNHVLKMLENNRGQHISGAHMAEELGISRNAIWKTVKRLEKEGHKIKATKNRGYCLLDDSDILSVVGMLPFLSDKQASKKIHIHASLESTNNTAKQLAISGAAHGTVVMAECQTAGKGRYGRSFFSPPGQGIYMSFVLRPTGRRWADAPTLLTIYAAVSVCRAIEELTKKEPKIKWVNDIFLDGKKICGILTEAVTDFESGSVHWAVVGIGINFKPAKTGLPEELKKIVGSVFEEDKASLTRNELAANIINHMIDFEAHIGKKETLNEYKKRLMMLGEKITVVGPKETYEAIARDIDDAGRLIVEKENGEIVPLFSGEIKIGAIEK